MTKRFGILTKNSYRFWRLKKTVRPIGEINNRTYRLDDSLFVAQSDAPNSILMYRQDSSQPLGDGIFVDPDMTKIYIDSLKGAHKKPTKFGEGITLNKLIPIFIIIAVIVSVIYGVTR